MDTIFINTENSETNESNRFRLKQNNSFSKFINLLHMGKYKI